MCFTLTLKSKDYDTCFLIKYTYPLHTTIYKILAKGDASYSSFLHKGGYSNGLKIFTFFDLSRKLKVHSSPIHYSWECMLLTIYLYFLETSKSLIEDLLKSQELVIANIYCKAIFSIQQILSLPNYLSRKELKKLMQRVMCTFLPVAKAIGMKENGRKYRINRTQIVLTYLNI